MSQGCRKGCPNNRLNILKPMVQIKMSGNYETRMDFAHHTVSEFENLFLNVRMAYTCLQGSDSLTWPAGNRGALER